MAASTVAKASGQAVHSSAEGTPSSKKSLMKFSKVVLPVGLDAMVTTAGEALVTRACTKRTRALGAAAFEGHYSDQACGDQGVGVGLRDGGHEASS